MNNKLKKIANCYILVILFTTGCARNIDSDVYTSNSLTGTVVEGTIISSRNVIIKEHDNLKQNTYGGLSGAALFGVAGSTIGGGKGSQLAGLGAGIVGSVLGAMTEDKFSSSTGTEYVVKLDNNRLIDSRAFNNNYQSNSFNNYPYGNNYRNNYRNANYRNNFQGDTIFVIQKDKSPLHVHQKVLVIYENGKARIVAKS